jgi:DNA-binding FadR family transcriptional regulator
MNSFTTSNYFLPGIRSFIRHNPMFRQIETRTAASSSVIIALADEAFQSGRLQPGDRFPSPDEIAKLTGASVAESLDAVTSLMAAGSIRQLPSGQLSISPQAVS